MIKLKIEGMTCDHCVASVKKALAKVPGVERVREVSRERGEASVDGAAPVEALIAAIKSEGYEAWVI